MPATGKQNCFVANILEKCLCVEKKTLGNNMRLSKLFHFWVYYTCNFTYGFQSHWIAFLFTQLSVVANVSFSQNTFDTMGIRKQV